MKSHIWLFVSALLLLAATPTAWPAGTELVSLSISGEQGNDHSGTVYEVEEGSAGPNIFACPISDDGRFIAFISEATNLVPGDINGWRDVFVRDRLLGTTQIVSLTVTGGQFWEGHPPPLVQDMSGDGRFISFMAPDPAVCAGGTCCFIQDRVAGTTEVVNLNSLGELSNSHPHGRASLSAEGRFVTFASEATNLVADDTNGYEDAFLRDRLAQTTERVSVSTSNEQGNGRSSGALVNGDGGFVAFDSGADNLVPGDTNDHCDVFVRDRVSGTTERVSLSTTGSQANDRCFAEAISREGRFVLMHSSATNLVPQDTNGLSDCFIRDRLLGITERFTVSSTGEQHDDPLGVCLDTAVSADGRFVVFDSRATNLVPDDTNCLRDIFLRDRELGTTERVSLTNWGAQSPGECRGCDMSPDGRWVSFASLGRLVESDMNLHCDVYVRDRWGFGDVPYAHWARLHIEACVAADIVLGYSPDRYQPSLPVTRDQMAVYIARALATPTGEQGVQAWQAPETPTFPDVLPGDWAYKHIEYAAAQNVVAGYDDDLYHPEYEVTRDQMAVYVARAMVAPSGEAALADYVPTDPRDFPDVPATGYGDSGTDPYWAYKHIEYCVEHDVVAGYEDGLYHPDIVVTRDQMAVYVARAFGLLS
jgi:Tol biopolymer transport system component